MLKNGWVFLKDHVDLVSIVFFSLFIFIYSLNADVAKLVEVVIQLI